MTTAMIMTLTWEQFLTTSAKMSSVAKQPGGGGVPGDGGVVSWSKGHVGVRDMVTKSLVQIPTVVKISESYRGDAQSLHKHSFHEGTVSTEAITPICRG